jgi:hypothetical protein
VTPTTRIERKPAPMMPANPNTVAGAPPSRRLWKV